MNIAGQALAGQEIPCHESYTIKPNRAELSPELKIAVGSLGNRADGALQCIVLDGPCSVRVLADVQRWIERKTPPAAPQQNTHGNPGHDRASSHGGPKS